MRIMTTTAMATVRTSRTPWVVTLPLILLAIPSIAIGFFSIGPMLYGTDWAGNHAHDAIKGAHTFFTGIVDFYDPARTPSASWARSSMARSPSRCTA